jgi:hypothetical protein
MEKIPLPEHVTTGQDLMETEFEMYSPERVIRRMFIFHCLDFGFARHYIRKLYRLWQSEYTDRSMEDFFEQIIFTF